MAHQLLVSLAHPEDESLGMGDILAEMNEDAAAAVLAYRR